MSTGRSEAQQSMGYVIILYICIHACMYISVHLYTVYTYLYIVVAVPRKDSMSPARQHEPCKGECCSCLGTATNLLDIYVINHNECT